MAALIIAIFPQNSSRGNWEEQQDRTDPNSQFELTRKPAWLLAFRQFGLPKWKHDFEFFLSHGTWWKIEVISPLCQKIRTIEFTLKISSKSKITRLHADLNPLSRTQKNLPFGENWERFYALWRERAREIPGARIHPYNMLLLTLTKSKQQRMDDYEDSVRVL